ncbi:MAG: AraC family transcriptional regulator [Gammaproteobacteria bacterium]|nr:MAG: AraC family transcriptional regulator [Gammaproteobacteria bacterium]
MINILSILTIGFSVISALILIVAYVFFLKTVNRSWHAILSCLGVMLSFAALQLGHLSHFLNGTDVVMNPAYRFCLFIAPAMFFFFGRATFLPEKPLHPLLLLHFTPILFNFFLRYEIAIPIIFMVGMGYCFSLAYLLFGLRAQRKRFNIEMSFFLLFCVIAILVLFLGISIPYIDHHYFYVFYTNSIGISLILVTAALIVFPELLQQLVEVSQLNYSASTLKDMDVKPYVEKLEQLMSQAKLYQNEKLNLGMTAEAVGLSPHQLSELVNREFAMNFSRYIREQRVKAAKAILVNEPSSSVLSISLEVGFNTQSNFYAAFKEITGVSPGAYRKSLSK